MASRRLHHRSVASCFHPPPRICLQLQCFSDGNGINVCVCVRARAWNGMGCRGLRGSLYRGQRLLLLPHQLPHRPLQHEAERRHEREQHLLRHVQLCARRRSLRRRRVLGQVQDPAVWNRGRSCCKFFCLVIMSHVFSLDRHMQTTSSKHFSEMTLLLFWD